MFCISFQLEQSPWVSVRISFFILLLFDFLIQYIKRNYNVQWNCALNEVLVTNRNIECENSTLFFFDNTNHLVTFFRTSERRRSFHLHCIAHIEMSVNKLLRRKVFAKISRKSRKSLSISIRCYKEKSVNTEYWAVNSEDMQYKLTHIHKNIVFRFRFGQ